MIDNTAYEGGIIEAVFANAPEAESQPSTKDLTRSTHAGIPDAPAEKILSAYDIF